MSPPLRGELPTEEAEGGSQPVPPLAGGPMLQASRGVRRESRGTYRRMAARGVFTRIFKSSHNERLATYSRSQ